MKGRAARILIAMAILMTACSSQGSTPPVSAPVTSTQVQGPTPSASETPDPVPANLSGPNGRIAFTRHDPSLGARAGDEESVTYTVNPDGSHVQQLFADAPSGRPRWSPDGTEIQIFCCDDGMAAHFIDPDTGDLRTLPPPDPTIETFCGSSWSPDGKRLTCEGFGVDDPSRNGIYSIRASDGGGLTRITSNPGGDDTPGDYSPDGRRLVFVRFQDERPVGLFVTNVDGSGLRRLTPTDMTLDDSGFAGSWSPTDDQILFVALASEDAHKAIWVVNADGSSLHQLPITPECGGLFSDPTSAGCYSPSWSPDGSKIVFTRSSADGARENIYTVSADGSGLFQVTDSGGDDYPDWGSHDVSPLVGAGGELAGCVPACIKGRTVPGDLPVGEYQTKWFFGGRMTLTFETPWTSQEDSTGEFFVAPLSTPENAVVFWEDIYPVENGERVDGVPTTAEGLLGWLKMSSNLDVSAPEEGIIGEDLPATVVDVSLSADAVNDDPECPFDACVNFLGFPQWDGFWGIAGPQVQRFYMSDVSYGGQAHLFVVVVYPDEPADMESFLPLAERLISTVRVPARPSA